MKFVRQGVFKLLLIHGRIEIEKDRRIGLHFKNEAILRMRAVVIGDEVFRDI